MNCRPWMLWAGVAGWLALGGASVAALLSFDLRPSDQLPAPKNLSVIDPSIQASLSLDPQRPTLVAFFHPKCPCSRVTADELVNLAAWAGDRLALRIVVVVPGLPDDAAAIASIRDVWKRFPQATAIADTGGQIASALGAKTSGHCIVYDVTGRLAFEGGVTPSRGHAGPSKGMAAIEQILAGRVPEVRRSEVYGCGLVSRSTIDLRPTSTEGGCASCPPIR